LSAICGFWLLNGDAHPQSVCARMMQTLVAYGSDESSLVASDRVALGHRLLKITAEDELEAQPLAADSLSTSGSLLTSCAGATSDAAIWLVADARIDNRVELAAEFDLSVNEAASMADSAFVLRAWLRWGRDCVQHLVGSFAFAVWDARAQQFFLARDHSGDRPLYYRKTAQSFAFATTARAIRACPGVSSELDEGQLARDLIGLPPEPPRTRFRDVQAIAPGHCLIVGREAATQRRYWQIDSLRPVRFARDQEYVEAFLEIFDEAVRCRLRTTGGVATELSAGLDSGSVAATAAGLLAAEGRTLAAYTAVPCPEFSGIVEPGLIADEGAYAAEVAALYPNLRHIRVDASGSNLLRELERIFPLLDLPHAAALNNVWGNRILDHAAASGVKVMLNGALGNFAFSYAGGDLLHERFRSGHWLATLRQAVRLRRMGLSSGRNAASLTIFSGMPWVLRRRVDPLIRASNVDWSALRPECARSFDAVDHFRRFLFTHSGTLPRLMATDFQQNQYGDYNAATGAGWGIEARDPTADKRVFEFCAAIPPEQFVAGGQGRSLARRAMRGRLPEATLDRKQKGTQSADWYESLSRIRGELSAELALQEQSPVARRLIDLERLRGMLAKWPQAALQAAQQDGIVDAAISRGVAVGYFIRRIEQEADGGSPHVNADELRQ
jgi:asparagine synthase (glutamine-hydrolysing)